jgi:RNA polymerase sigma factor (sigma-70 family)
MSPRFSIRSLASQPDRRLVELAAAGNERAFETLLRRHRRALAGYCRRIGVPEHRVDDALQQVMTKAWLALCVGVEVREPRAWLHRIAHNAAINSIRVARLHSHESIETVPAAETPWVAGDLDAGLRARDALGHVASLPASQREAIVLTAIEGRSHEEAAGVMGLSDGAVRGLLYRARTTLRGAAAALSPHGLLALLGRAPADSSLAERTVEASGPAAAAGAAGIVGKGLLVTAVAGLLAAGGTVAHLESAHQRRGAHATPRTGLTVASSAPRLTAATVADFSPRAPLAASYTPVSALPSRSTRRAGGARAGRRSADRGARGEGSARGERGAALPGAEGSPSQALGDGQGAHAGGDNGGAPATGGDGQGGRAGPDSSGNPSAQPQPAAPQEPIGGGDGSSGGRSSAGAPAAEAGSGAPGSRHGGDGGGSGAGAVEPEAPEAQASRSPE